MQPPKEVLFGRTMSLPDMEAAMSPKGMQEMHVDPFYRKAPYLAGMDWFIRFVHKPSGMPRR